MLQAMTDEDRRWGWAALEGEDFCRRVREQRAFAVAKLREFMSGLKKTEISPDGRRRLKHLFMRGLRADYPACTTNLRPAALMKAALGCYRYSRTPIGRAPGETEYYSCCGWEDGQAAAREDSRRHAVTLLRAYHFIMTEKGRAN